MPENNQGEFPPQSFLDRFTRNDELLEILITQIKALNDNLAKSAAFAAPTMKKFGQISLSVNMLKF